MLPLLDRMDAEGRAAFVALALTFGPNWMQGERPVVGLGAMSPAVLLAPPVGGVGVVAQASVALKGEWATLGLPAKWEGMLRETPDARGRRKPPYEWMKKWTHKSFTEEQGTAFFPPASSCVAVTVLLSLFSQATGPRR
jgi:hypothetical protein